MTMKRNRLKRRSSLGRDAEQLIRLATGLASSGSIAEDRYWDGQLVEAIDHLLEEQDENALNAALDQLASDAHGYESLADFIEFRTEFRSTLDAEHDVLLVGAPILAWSHFRIPATTIPPAILANLRAHLAAHIFASGAKLALADFLFSPDQLPHGYCASATFAATLGQAALADTNLHIESKNLPETAHFLSDTRYLLAAVAVPKGQPFFSWQEENGSRDEALAHWRSQGGASLVPLLPGCATEVVLPEAYFAASRQADRESRPYAIQASAAFLSAELETPVANLRAVIAPFHDRELEEYRIGFSRRDEDGIVHGVVWPLLGVEDESADIPGQIETVLRACGVGEVIYLDHRFPLEFCDDCGAPMYPSAEGETIHAEMPEGRGEEMPRHLH